MLLPVSAVDTSRQNPSLSRCPAPNLEGAHENRNGPAGSTGPLARDKLIGFLV